MTAIQMASLTDVENWVEEVVKPIYLGGGHSFSVDKGRKYFRIWQGNSCYGFVDMDGNVLKSATWRAPAPHVRGNIFSEQNGREALDKSGFVRYLR